jgi:hypothetical protein
VLGHRRDTGRHAGDEWASAIADSGETLRERPLFPSVIANLHHQSPTFIGLFRGVSARPSRYSIKEVPNNS